MALDGEQSILPDLMASEIEGLTVLNNIYFQV